MLTISEHILCLEIMTTLHSIESLMISWFKAVILKMEMGQVAMLLVGMASVMDKQ